MKHFFTDLSKLIRIGEQSGHLVHSIDRATQFPIGPDHPLYPFLESGKVEYERLLNYMRPKVISQVLLDCGARVPEYLHDRICGFDPEAMEGPPVISVFRVNRIQDIGVTKPESFDTIETLAAQVGLGRLPVQTGPLWRIAHMEDQRVGDSLTFASNRITGRAYHPGVIVALRPGEGCWLSHYWTNPDDRWNPGASVAFGLASSESQIT